jgi:hypothetical protein
MNADGWTELSCHPLRCALAVRAIRVRVRRAAGGELSLSYRLDGDIARIEFPPPSPPRIGFELWRHTCFEAFIAIDGQTAYHEFNLSPSGEWTVYAFRGYREGGPLTDETARPRIAVSSTATTFALDASLSLGALSTMHPRARLQIALAAVIESAGELSYWALQHPGPRPDFHNRASFTLVLEPPSPAS